MKPWNVFDRNHDFLGVVEAESEEEALRLAFRTIPHAETVEERTVGHHQSGAQ